MEITKKEKKKTYLAQQSIGQWNRVKYQEFPPSRIRIYNKYQSRPVSQKLQQQQQ